MFSKELAGILVEDTKCFVSRRADEDQVASCNQGAAIVLCPSRWGPTLGAFGIFAQWNFPFDLARVEIDGIQRTPWRLDGRIALVVVPTTESAEGVDRLLVLIDSRLGCSLLRFLFLTLLLRRLSCKDIVNDRLESGLGQEA